MVVLLHMTKACVRMTLSSPLPYGGKPYFQKARMGNASVLIYRTRNLFTATTGNANDLAYIVQYIRRELKILDEYDSEKLNDGRIQFSQPEAHFESS